MIGGIIVLVAVVAAIAIHIRLQRGREECPNCEEGVLDRGANGVRYESEYGYIDVITRYSECSNCGHRDSELDVTSVEDFEIESQ